MSDLIANGRQTAVDLTLASSGSLEGIGTLMAANPMLADPFTLLPEGKAVAPGTVVAPQVAAFLSGQAPETKLTPPWVELAFIDVHSFGCATSYWAHSNVYGPQGGISVGDEWGFAATGGVRVDGVFRLPNTGADYGNGPLISLPLQSIRAASVTFRYLPHTLTVLAIAGWQGTDREGHLVGAPERIAVSLPAFPPQLKELYLVQADPVAGAWPSLPHTVAMLQVQDGPVPPGLYTTGKEQALAVREGITWLELDTIATLPEGFDNLECCAGLAHLALRNLGLVQYPFFKFNQAVLAELDLFGNALTEYNVNALLGYLTAYPSLREVDLSGGTNAAPTGTGAAAKAYLQTHGVSVITN